jgi:hypothetical protein
LAGWLRLEPPEPVDAAVLALMCDNWPPTARYLAADEAVHTITLQLTVYFRARPIDVAAQEHCLIVLRPGGTIGGVHQEDGEVWSADGRVLATSRQVALVYRDERPEERPEGRDGRA